MLSLLLVDDEPGQLIGFRRILQKLRPGCRISLARNGVEALALCRQEGFDLIFTDIQMPHMNGLELMEELRRLEQARAAKVIVLSGYDYFEYAQKALTNRAFGYLLKPLDYGALQNTLQQAEAAIEQEQNQRREQEALSRKLLEWQPAYSSKLLLQWMNGALPAERLAEIPELLPFRGAGRIGIMKLHDAQPQEPHRLQDCARALQPAVETLLRSHGASCCAMVLTDAPGEELIIVFDAQVDASLAASLTEVLASGGSHSGKAVLGLSSQAPGVLLSAPQLVREARLALLQHFYLPDQRLFCWEHSRLDPCYKPASSPKAEDQLLDAVRSGREEEVRFVLSELFQRVVREKYPLPEVLRSRCKLLMLKLLDGLDYLRESEARDSFAADMEAALDAAADCRTLLGAMERLLLQAAETRGELRRHRRENMVYQCLEYIDRHYMEDLSLDAISGRFDLSPGYFSQYFKSQLDINFSKYLNQVRLKHAKRLLETCEDKVYEVASKVGYQEVKYFNRVFKKELGMTPEEFRRVVRSSRMR